MELTPLINELKVLLREAELYQQAANSEGVVTTLRNMQRILNEQVELELCELNCHIWKPLRHAGLRVKNWYRCSKCGKEKQHIQPPVPERKNPCSPNTH